MLCQIQACNASYEFKTHYCLGINISSELQIIFNLFLRHWFLSYLYCNGIYLFRKSDWSEQKSIIASYCIKSGRICYRSEWARHHKVKVFLLKLAGCECMHMSKRTFTTLVLRWFYVKRASGAVLWSKRHLICLVRKDLIDDPSIYEWYLCIRI